MFHGPWKVPDKTFSLFRHGKWVLLPTGVLI